MVKARITDADKGRVAVEMDIDAAEALGHRLYTYTLKYTINGAKFKRQFAVGALARSYAEVLRENGIQPTFKAKRAAKGDRASGAFLIPVNEAEVEPESKPTAAQQMYGVIPSSWIPLSESHRWDAKFWLRVKAECSAQNIQPHDLQSVREVVRKLEAAQG